jgi:hypothetical protein
MYANVDLRNDATTLYVRWEIGPEGGEGQRLARLGGPLVLRIQTRQYVDEAGKLHERIDLEVPVFPHAGRVNRGQAKFLDHEARRRFVENLVDGVTVDAATWLDETDPASVPVEGHAIFRPETRGATASA